MGNFKGLSEINICSQPPLSPLHNPNNSRRATDPCHFSSASLPSSPCSIYTRNISLTGSLSRLELLRDLHLSWFMRWSLCLLILSFNLRRTVLSFGSFFGHGWICYVWWNACVLVDSTLCSQETEVFRLFSDLVDLIKGVLVPCLFVWFSS